MTSRIKDSERIQSLIPCWTVPGDTTSSQISSTFERLAKDGVTDVIIRKETLSNSYVDWFDTFGTIVEEAKSRGLHIWLNEKLNLNQPDKKTSAKYLEIRHESRGEMDIDSFVPGNYMVAGRFQGGVITRTRIIEDADNVELLDDSWMIFNCHIGYERDTVDLLSKDAVSEAAEATFGDYYNRYSADFGKTIRSVFNIDNSASSDSLEWRIPYTDGLFELFEQRFGYSALANLPYLFFQIDTGMAFRSDFWTLIADLFSSNYHNTLADWCKSHSILYTGYNNAPELPGCQIPFAGDSFESARIMDIGGASQTKTDFSGPFATAVSTKIVSSESHADEKRYAMSAMVPSNDTQLKNIIDWQIVSGANLIVIDGIDGISDISTYTNRLCDMIGDGKHICNLLVLYPMSGLFSCYQPNCKTQEFERTENFLNSLCIELAERQLDFDLVDFPTLCQASIEDRQLVLGNERYSILVIPHTPYMRPKEYEAIKRISEHVETYFFYRAVDPEHANMPSQTNGVRFVMTNDIQGMVMRLRHAIDGGIHLSGTGREDFLVLEVEKDDRCNAFIVNRSENIRKLSARFNGSTNLTRIEIGTGDSQPIECKTVNGKSETEIELEPYQTMLISAEGRL